MFSRLFSSATRAAPYFTRVPHNNDITYYDPGQNEILIENRSFFDIDLALTRNREDCKLHYAYMNRCFLVQGRVWQTGEVTFSNLTGRVRIQNSDSTDRLSFEFFLRNPPRRSIGIPILRSPTLD